MTANGTITTIAGTGFGDNPFSGVSGDGGAATAAEFFYPQGVALDNTGNLFIADTDGQRIRKIATNGTISTVAGNGSSGFNGDGSTATSALLANPQGLAVDTAGNVYIADTSNGRVRVLSSSGSITTVAGNYVTFSGDNSPATFATLNAPISVAVDNSGNLFIADSINARIRKVAADGTISTIAGTGSLSSTGDNGPAVSAAIAQPSDVTVDGNGNVYFATSGSRVRKISTNGTISTVAGNGTFGYSGNGGPATSAELDLPQGIAVDVNGDLYIADSSNNVIRKVTPDGLIATIAGTGTPGFSGDGGPATAAQLQYPRKLALDAVGNLYIADYSNSRIRKVGLDGTISTFSTLSGPYAVATDESGNVLVSSLSQIFRLPPGGGSSVQIAGAGSGNSGDGGPALMAAISAVNLAVSPSGAIFFADNLDNVIRKLTPVSTGTAAMSVSPAGINLRISASTQSPLTVSLNGSGTFSWNATSTVATPPNGNWLSLVSSSGTGSGNFDIQANPIGLRRPALTLEV